LTDGIKSLNLPGIWGKIRLRGDRPKQSARRASAELRGELLVGRVPVTILIVVGALAPLWMIEMSPPLGAALPDRAHLASAPAHEFRIPPRPFSVPIDFPRDPKSNRPGALPLEPVDGINIAPPPPEFIERTFTIKKGDTLMPLLIGAGLPRSQAHAAITALTKHFKPKNIRPGHKMTLKFKDGGDVGVKPVFAALVFQPNIYNTITTNRICAIGPTSIW